MKLKNIVPWGRSFNEYLEIFSLSDDDLNTKILGCGDGPAAFNAELTARGGDIISVDPTYRFDTAALRSRIAEVYDEVVPQLHADKEKYLWKRFASVEELAEERMAAMELFLADFAAGKENGRYVQASLPELPFNDQQFDLALCSHYLFLYSAHVDLGQHLAAMKELCRVAREVRVYPLIALDGALSPHLQDVMADLNEHGLTTTLVAVSYQFQKGATEMLVVKAASGDTERKENDLSRFSSMG